MGILDALRSAIGHTVARNPNPYDLNNIGKLFYAIFVGCPLPPQVWLKAAGVAALKVFTTNVDPVWKQDVKVVTGKTWLKHLTQRLEKIQPGLPAFTDGLTNALHFTAEVADKTTFWIWIASMLSDFLVRWMTLALRRAGCLDGQKSCVTTGSNPTGVFFASGSWNLGPVFREDFPTPGLNIPPIVFCPANSSLNIGVACVFVKFGGGPVGASLRVRQENTGDIVFQQSYSEQQSISKQGPVVSFNVNRFSQPDTRYIIECMSTDHAPLGIGYESGQITITRGDCIDLM